MPQPPQPPSDSRLDAISTQHSLLRAAHHGSITSAGPARNALALRYRRAIRGYLGALLKDDQDADEVAQMVLVKLLQGDFARATPDRGRFRDYLKVAVRNTALTHLRRKDSPLRHELADDTAACGGDEEWLADWRRTVLDRAWDLLQEHERSRPGNLAYTLLRLLADHPDDDSEQLAERVSAILGRPIRADAVRKQISRARRKFAELLLDEVAETLDEPSPDRVEEELIETGLMDHVRDFLPENWKTSFRPGSSRE